jgi:hypothetical protein
MNENVILIRASTKIKSNGSFPIMTAPRDDQKCLDNDRLAPTRYHTSYKLYIRSCFSYSNQKYRTSSDT